MLKDQGLEEGMKVRFQTSSHEERPLMQLFFCREWTNESVEVSSGLMARVKLSDDEELWTGYMLEERRSIKSTYSHLRILFLSFCGRGGKCGSVGLLCGCATGSKLNGSKPGVTVFTSRGLVPSGLQEGRVPSF